LNGLKKKSKLGLNGRDEFLGASKMSKYGGKSGYLPSSKCIGKIRYNSQQSADVVVRRSRDNGMESYYCVYCGFFHVGHKIGIYKARMTIARKKAHIKWNAKPEKKKRFIERDKADASKESTENQPSISDRVARSTPKRPEPVYSTGEWVSVLGDRVRYSRSSG
jgi:hypothetical protein